MEEITPEQATEALVNIVMAVYNDPETALSWAVIAVLVVAALYVFIKLLIPRWIRALARTASWVLLTTWLFAWAMQFWTDAPARQRTIYCLGALYLLYAGADIVKTIKWAMPPPPAPPRSPRDRRIVRYVGKFAWRVVSLPFKIRFKRGIRLAKPAVPQPLPEV